MNGAAQHAGIVAGSGLHMAERQAAGLDPGPTELRGDSLGNLTCGTVRARLSNQELHLRSLRADPQLLQAS